MVKAVCLASVILAANLTADAPAAPLRPEQVRVEGMKVTILPAGQSVDIEPLEVTRRQAEGTLKVGQPTWRGPFYLPGVAWTFRALRPGSLVVALAERPEAKLVEGKDYLLNPNWGTLAAVESSQIPAGANLRFEYEYTKSRLDLIEQTPEGRVVVRKGREDMGEPLLPDPSPGATPLASVYLPNNTTRLTMANVNLIDPLYDGVPPVSGAQFIRALKDKLASGKPATIVFFGDSITAQQPKDFRDGLGSFVDRFAKYLEAKHPNRTVTVTPKDQVVAPGEGQVVIVKAGVGGDDTPRALKRIDRDALSHKPDAVVIMFGVNDENVKGPGTPNNVPPDRYKANLATIVDKVQQGGAEAVIMTTSMKNLGWEHTGGNLSEYAAAARQVAREKKTCLIDNFKAWEELPKRGYNYMVFLGTCINHPVDLGHDLFFRGLKAALEADRP